MSDNKNIIKEWAKDIKTIAQNAYGVSSTYRKDEYMKEIIGMCNAIIKTLDCCD